MTGYELKKFFDLAVSHFWSADHTQIYRTLNRLEQDGLISSKQELQTKRPNRKRYSLTEAGLTELTEWLNEDQEPLTYRDAFLIQIFFGKTLSVKRLQEMINTQQEAHKKRSETFDGLREVIRETAHDDLEAVLESLTLDFGVMFERTYIEWLEQAQATLQALSEES